MKLLLFGFILFGVFCCGEGRTKSEDESSFGRILSINQEASKLVDSSGSNLKKSFFEGDIILTAKSSVFPHRAEARRQFGSASDINLLWPRKTIPYILDDSIKFEPGRNTLNAIQAAFAEYANKTCIQFKARTDERDYIKLFKGGGCWSLVGRNGGKQDLSIGAGCEQKGVVVHELMHALGFWHEQSRPDRDQYVEIVTENIIDGYEDQFKKYDKGEIDSRGSRYDFRSIMHYSSTAFSKNGKDTVKIKDPLVSAKLGQRIGLSDTDVEQITALYKCDTKSVNGNWGEWSPYSPCSKACGKGKQIRFRECNNPRARNGGEQCPGSGTEEKECFLKTCSLSCNFDQDNCMWTDADDDDFNWRRRSGPTPSDGTGPRNDHTLGTSAGSYVYIEASSPQTNGDVARFESPLVKDSSEKRCLVFWYSMVGATVGTLEAILDNGRSRKGVWLLRGPQGDEWSEAHIPIPPNNGDFRVVLQAVRGLDYRGDIAIDDVQLGDGNCDLLPTSANPTGQLTTAPPLLPTTTPQTGQTLNCNFESPNCAWKDTVDRDYINWIRYKGKTLSKGTGPDFDHTTGTGEGYYLYIEGSAPQVTGDNARFVSPQMSVNTLTSPKCLRFFYFMYGEHIDQLKVNALMSDGNEAILWSLKGDQGPSWREAKVPLPSLSNFQVVIEGIIGDSYLSDIAIDDISIRDENCALLPTEAIVRPLAPTTVTPTTTEGTLPSSSSTEVIIEVLAAACHDSAGVASDEQISGLTGYRNTNPGSAIDQLGYHRGRSRGRGRGKALGLGLGGGDDDDVDDRITSYLGSSSNTGRDSTGCQSAKSSIKVNGVEHGGGQEGHNLILVNAKKGVVFGKGHFDTNKNIFASLRLEQYINDLPAYTVFIIATQGKADSKLLASTASYFPPTGGSLALVGYRGGQKIEWVKKSENVDGRGPSRMRLKFMLSVESTSTRKIIVLKKETFNGNTFLPIPAKYNSVLNLGKADFTITVWVKTTSDGTILSKVGEDTRYNPQMKVIYIEKGLVTVMLTQRFVAIGKTSVSNGRWHLVTLLVQGKTSPYSVALLIDGQLEWQKSFMPEEDDATYTMKVAHTVASFPKTPTFVGDINELVYYDRVMSRNFLDDLVKNPPS